MSAQLGTGSSGATLVGANDGRIQPRWWQPEEDDRRDVNSLTYRSPWWPRSLAMGGVDGGWLLDPANIYDLPEITQGVSSDVGARRGVVWRYTDASNYYRAYLNAGTREVVFETVVAGVRTIVQRYIPATWNTAPELRVVCQGSRHRIYLDRVLVIDATDSSLATGTTVGLDAELIAGAGAADDFYGQGLSVA